MTQDFTSFFKKYSNPLEEEPIIEEESQQLRPVAATPMQAGLQKFEQAGGALLTTGVKGIAAMGQSIMGVFDYLENNTGAYDQLYGKQEDGSYDKRAGSFHWDKVDDFVGGALKAGASQGQRVLQSKNLTEMGQNMYTGVDFLKALPGGAGEFYRDQSSQSAKVATAIAGFGLEVLLDPTSKIAGVAYKGGSALTNVGVKAGILSERAADVGGRLAANAATGNWVGGAIAMGAREGSFAAKEKLVTFANKMYGTKRGRAAETVLEWAMGPSALTTNTEMRTVLAKYAAMKEDLPKEMLKIANTTATVVSHLPAKQRTEAQKLFGQLASSQTDQAENAALDALARLGVKRDQAASIGAAYRTANLRLMDIIQSSAKDVPGLEGVSKAMSEFHVRKSYRMFVDPRVREDWLDHLVRQNTAGSWQIKNTSLRSQLLDGLGVTETAVPKIDTTFGPDLNNTGNVVGGFDTFRPKTAFSATASSGERQAALQLEIMKTDDLIKNATPGTDVSSFIRVKERLTQQVEQLDKLTAGTGPNQFASPRIKKLQSQIDMLDNAISTSSEKNLDKLTSRRNTLQAQLENEINKNTPNNSGGYGSKVPDPRRNIDQRYAPAIDDRFAPAMDYRFAPAIDDRFAPAIDDRFAPSVDYQFGPAGSQMDMSFPPAGAKGTQFDYDVSGKPATPSIDYNFPQTKPGMEFDYDVRGTAKPMDFGFTEPNVKPQIDDNFPPAKNVVPDPINYVFLPPLKEALKESGDHHYIPTPNKILKETRLAYVDDLQKFMAENEGVKQSQLVGFRKGENGEILADFSDRYKDAKQLTLKDIQEWTADWAKARNIDEDEIGKLNASVSNALTYVPGSREFVSMVREKGQALNDLDPQLREILQAEIGISKVDTSAVQDRTLDPLWQDLFGSIDNFSVNTAQQGVAVGEIAAKGRMLSELRQRGLVVTEKELADNPDLNNAGGWVRMDNIFKREGENTAYYMQRTNQRSLEAIDRSLGDMNKMQVLSQASNLFRRAALITDPSAHATQFLGNMAMLQMMGFRRLFGNDVNVVKGMNQAFKSVMLSDDSFKDAVDAGVMVTQTILSEQQSAQLARSLLNLPRYGERNADRLGAMTNIFRIAQDVYGSGAAVKDTALRRGVKGVASGLEIIPGLKEGTKSIDAAGLHTSAAAMFQLSDQMTRMFAYRSAVANKTQDLIKANPVLANFTQDSGTRINWDAVTQHIESGAKPGLTLDDVKGWKETHSKLREEAAQLANDVALNYSDVPLAVNYLSKTGVVPFIKFQYKATGRIMQFMDERPWAFSPYYAAQRNLNDGLNPDPDHFEEQRMSLSPTVRDAMVIPTGQRDSMGRQEFVDMSRWLPFGMFASAANGGGQEGGLAMQPSSVVSTPILDVYHSFINAEEEKQPGQSMASFMAQKLTETFSPAGVGVGSRKVETLANAIQQSMLYVDNDGQVVERTPNAVENVIKSYADIPEKLGHALTVAGNNAMGQDTLTTALGSPKEQTANRPRTTVEQAWGRYGVPGVGFSSDPEKTSAEYDKRYDMRANELTRLRNSVLSSAGPNITVEQLRQVERIDNQINMLEQQRLNKGAALLVGE